MQCKKYSKKEIVEIVGTRDIYIPSSEGRTDEITEITYLVMKKLGMLEDKES